MLVCGRNKIDNRGFRPNPAETQLSLSQQCRDFSGDAIAASLGFFSPFPLITPLILCKSS